MHLYTTVLTVFQNDYDETLKILLNEQNRSVLQWLQHMIKEQTWVDQIALIAIREYFKVSMLETFKFEHTASCTRAAPCTTHEAVRVHEAVCPNFKVFTSIILLLLIVNIYTQTN
jgi:hypothetical protein